MKSLLAYAFLHTSFNEGLRSPLDILDRVVVRSLVFSALPQITDIKCQSLVEKDWGIKVPVNVLRYTLGRLRSRGIIVFDKSGRAADEFVVVGASVVKDQIRLKEAAARAVYDRIKSNIDGWLMRDENRLNLSADEVLEKWLDDSATSFLGGAADAKAVSRIDREVNKVIVSAGKLLEPAPDEQFLQDLSELALGDVLYRSLREIVDGEVEDISTKNDARLPMDDVSVYLDVGVLFRACGFFGARHEAAALELLDMARRTGCKLKTFQHTSDEMSEGIAAVASSIQRNPSGAYGPIVTYALENGLTAADLLAILSDLKNDCCAGCRSCREAIA